MQALFSSQSKIRPTPQPTLRKRKGLTPRFFFCYGSRFHGGKHKGGHMDAQGGLRLHGIALGVILALAGTPRADVVTASAQNDAVKVTATGDRVLAVRTNGTEDFDVIVAGEASIATISLEAQLGHTLHSPQKPVKLPHADISDPITRNEFDYDCPSTLNGDEEPGQGKVRKLTMNMKIEDSSTVNFSPQLAEAATLNVRLDPPPPEGGYSGVFFELEIVRNLDGGVTQHIQWIDVIPACPDIDRARNADFTTLSFTWNGIPHPQYDGNATLATGPDEFAGVSGNFKRILPAVTAGQPVPPPLYYAVARLKCVADQSVLAEDVRVIHVPQVVAMTYALSALDMLREPLLVHETTLVVDAYTDIHLDQLRAAIEDSIAIYYGTSVNLIICSEPWPLPPFSTITLERGTGASPYGEADHTDFGNMDPEGTADIFAYRHRLDCAIAYLEDPTFPIPVSPSELNESMGKTTAHEIAHLLGLVARNSILDGTVGSHNPGPHLPWKIMNPPFVDDLEDYLGRNGPWSFREINHDYLKFILPTPQGDL
jgi:hypothetical protein